MFELQDQHKMVQAMVRQWCERRLLPRLPALEAGEEMPFPLMREMVRTFGLDSIATAAARKRMERLREGGLNEKGDKGDGKDEDGGAAGDDPMLAYVLIKELSRVSPGFAMGFGVTMGLAGGTIVARGTAEQIERWALPLFSCDKIGSWCLTEPGAGSDAFGSMRTTARPDASADGGYILSGSKTFITNGPCADTFVVYARIDHGHGHGHAPAVGTFVLERGMPGFSVGKPFKKMGMRDSPTCELFFDDVWVPKEHLLGGERRGEPGGMGRQHAKEGLLSERSGVPAMAWGIVERCYELARDYVQKRQQFGRPIGEFQAVQLKIAAMYMKLRLVESVVFRTAWMQAAGQRDAAFINASKAWCAEAAVEVAMTAIQLHGGYGYMEEYHIEKLARDAKLLELGAGTTDINYLTAARAELGIG
jgi:acyl-CoA dehydrogenase